MWKKMANPTFFKKFFRNFVFFLNQCGSPPCFLDQIKNFFLRSRRLSAMCEFITGQMSFLITRMTKQVHTYKLSGTFWVRSPKWWHWGKPKFADANTSHLPSLVLAGLWWESIECENRYKKTIKRFYLLFLKFKIPKKSELLLKDYIDIENIFYQFSC